MLAYYDFAFALLAAGAAAFAAALALVGSLIGWSATLQSRTQVLIGRVVWWCLSLACSLIASACILVLIHVP